MRFIFLVLFTFFLQSCSLLMVYNPFYNNLTYKYKYQFTKSKQLKTYELTQNNIDYFLNNGYLIIGKSSFRDTYQTAQFAINTAQYLGSDVLLYKNKYVGTSKGVATVPVYVPGTVYNITSSTQGAFEAKRNSNTSYIGNGGFAYVDSYSKTYGTYNSSSITSIQTPGTYSFRQVPYSNNYYDQYAYFLKKILYRTNEEKVWFYEKKNTNSNIFTKVEPNEWFVLLKEGKRFHKIEYKGLIGFISASHKIR